MVNNWEIEWNSSMIQHGRDTGTMEFIFAKGGNLSDMNYVMFDIQDNTWEPLIKAVAERENSHPDIIRKEAEQPQQQYQPLMANRNQQAAQPFMNTAVTSPRQATNQYNTAQRMKNLDSYHGDPNAMNAMRAGKYGAAAGHAAAKTGRAIMGAGRGAAQGAMNAGQAAGRGMAAGAGAAMDFAQNTAGPAMGRAYGSAKDKTGQAARAAGRGMAAGAGAAMDFAQNTAGPAMGRAGQAAGRGMQAAGRATMDAGGRALQAVKDSGIGERMKNFMGAAGRGAKQVGRGISNLRHAPAAAKQSFGQMRAAGEDDARRSALEGGLGRGHRENEKSSRQFVPGSADYDSQMDGAQARTSQGLARDFNISPTMNNAGEATQSTEDAMRDEVKRIGERRAEPQEGFMDGMKRRGEERRGAREAQQAAFAPSNMGEEDKQEELATGSPEAEAAANEDAPVEAENTMPDITKPKDPQPGPPTPAPAETATATEPDPREQFADQMVDEAGYKPGSSRNKAREVALGQYDKPEGGYDAITAATGKGGYRGKLAQAIASHHGMSPAQAQATVQSAEAGNPEAKEMVEEVKNTMPDLKVGQDDQLALSSKKHQASWDSVLKGLNVR